MKTKELSCIFCKNNRLKTLASVEQYKILECKNCNIAFTYPPPTLPDYENEDFHNKEKIEGKLKLIKDLPNDWQELI